MKRNLLVLGSFLLSFALAQFQGPSPEMRAKMEPYFNLMSSVSLLLELEKTSDLPLSSEQAAQLLPILNELKTSQGYTAGHATELLDTIELEILSPEQLVWMDGEFLKQQEARQNGGGGGFFGRPGGQNDGGNANTANANGGTPSTGGPGGRAGGPGGQGGFFQRIMDGEPVNLFLDNPNATAVLDELLGLLSAKTG